MKRLSDDSSRNIKEENCLCYPLEEDGLLPWTQDEDFFLQKEISGNRRVSWRTLSIRFNKKFASSRRSCGECRKRWEDCEEAKWSNAEELLLLLGLHIYGENWELLRFLVPERRDPLLHFTKMAREVKKKVEAREQSEQSSIKDLQLLVCIQHFLREKAQSSHFTKIKVKLLHGSSLTENHYLDYLSQFSLRQGLSKKWDLESLDKHIDNIMEELQNSIQAQSPCIEPPEEIQLVRAVPSMHPALQIHACSLFAPFLRRNNASSGEISE